MPHEVFISHSHENRAVAQTICRALESAGIVCWMAPRNILPSDVWEDAIVRALETCRVMVLVFSRPANESKQVGRELSLAANRSMPILPVRIEDTRPSGRFAYYLTDRHWLDALPEPLDQYLDYLVDTTLALLGRSADQVSKKTQPEATGVEVPEETNSPDVPDASRTFEIAYNYANGLDGLPKDPARAAELFQQAADQGHPGALSQLGLMYYHGQGGLQKDVPKAIELLQRAAALGDSSAISLLQLLPPSPPASQQAVEVPTRVVEHVEHKDSSLIDVSITIVGKPNSGKTSFLAGAFREWSTGDLGDLSIVSTSSQASLGNEEMSLAQISDVLYESYKFPPATLACQRYTFQLAYKGTPIAKFAILDYPGTALNSNLPHRPITSEADIAFWDHVDSCDGLILLADMSRVRTTLLDNYIGDWFSGEFDNVTQRVMERQGQHQTIPVAFVLAKCDEYINSKTGMLDLEALKYGLEELGLAKIEPEWRELCQTSGVETVEFATWITTAITFSDPDPKSQEAPFRLFPPPPAISPTGCVSPLLWTIAKALREHVPAFYNSSATRLFAPSHVRKLMDAIQEIDRVAENRSGRA